MRSDSVQKFYFYLSVIALFITFCSPYLFAEGMFFDGVTYAAISKNLALGKGSFWDPFYTETIFPSFHEHPQLVFGIEGFFHKVFGTESFLVERFYSVGCYVLIGFMIVRIWRLVTGETRTGWFALLLFVITPSIIWAVPNNMLENSMGVFIIAGVLLYLKTVLSPKCSYVYVILSGLMLFLAGFCKGFSAFFPWSLPLWIFIFTRKISFKQVVIHTLLLIFFSIAPFVLMVSLSEAAYNSFAIYINTQFLAALDGSRANVVGATGRFYVVKLLLQDLLIPVLLTGIALLIVKWRKVSLSPVKQYMAWVWVFLALGLSAVIPIMVSTKQHSSYILPAFPYFAILLGLLLQPYLMQFMDGIQTQGRGFKIFKMLTIVFLTGVLAFSISRTGTIARDKSTVQMLRKFDKDLPDGTTIGVVSIDSSGSKLWRLHAYFMRRKSISLDADTTKQYLFYLSPKEEEPGINLQQYQKINETDEYFLFKKKKTKQ